jgi:flagellar M-ring protein FliF
MGSIGQMFKQLGQMYADLSIGKKVSFFLFLAIGIAAFVVLVTISKRPDYRILYTDLAPEDINGIVSFLKDNRIQYKIEQGGSAVAVPSADFYDARMQLAGAGLPQGGNNGFELFDGKTLGMTDFQQSINYQRALQGELARSIQQLAPVDSARVHLVLPKESLFKEDQHETTASVAVKMRNGSRLTEEQVESVVFLVSGSVEGLDPSNVTVIDSKGKILSKKREDDVAGPINSAMLDYKDKIEKDLEQSIISLLSKSVGAEKVAAKVSALIDFRQISRTEEKFDPDSQVARSERMVDETSDSMESNPSGAPGTDANQPDEPAVNDESQSAAKSQKRTETINYEITRVVSQINEPVGEIEKLSIAVMIDGTYKIVDGEKTYSKRTDEEMEKFTQLVKKAVGFSATRGDELEVQNIAFSADEAFDTSAGVGDSKKELIFTIANHALIGVGFILFALFVLRPLMKWLTAEPAYEQVAELAGMLPSGVAELEEKVLGEKEKRRLDSLPAGADGAQGGDDKMANLKDRRDKILASAKEDKKAIASVVKKWLSEEE